uniref:Uncharacterized protein n=1 Tax=Sphaerodactylus townsendi TaxID=933632 RepID=A0ACB8ERR2_9SAUR
MGFLCHSYLHILCLTLATELQRNVKEIRTRIRHTKKIQQEKKYDSGISKESVHRAQYLAASILNISKTDLDDILDVEDDEVTEQIKREHENDKEWMSYLQKLLEGQSALLIGNWEIATKAMTSSQVFLP